MMHPDYMPRNVKADLHNHFRTSSWVKSSDLEQAAECARKKLGPGAVIGLVNFRDSRYENTLDKAVGIKIRDFGNAAFLPDYDVLIIKGEETPTRQGHLLSIGVPAGVHYPAFEDIENTLAHTFKPSVLNVADHPFYHQGLGHWLRNKKESDSTLGRLIHGYEIHNGEAALGFNNPILGKIFPPRANELAQDYFFTQIAESHPSIFLLHSSDGHSFDEIGTSWTEIFMPSNYHILGDQKRVTEFLEQGLVFTRENDHRAQAHNSPIYAAKHVAELAGIITNAKLAKKIGGPFAWLDDKFHGKI